MSLVTDGLEELAILLLMTKMAATILLVLLGISTRCVELICDDCRCRGVCLRYVLMLVLSMGRTLVEVL